MASASSSSKSMSNYARKYDVFISFRGEDTRLNFISHLHNALKKDFFVTFRDDKDLEIGDEIAPSLIQAIKDSIVCVVVLSENYASSRWCLDELAQIMQCREEEGQFVIPIFYKVDPSHVRNLRGTYKEAFEELEKKHDHEIVTRWKAALSKAANLSGKHFNQTFMDESNFIREIVAYVNTKLERVYSCEGPSEDLIGIDEMIKPIEVLLEKYQNVGIWGMGGMGKTTMAKEVFNRLSSQYDNHCFLKNVREQTERNGLDHVRSLLVSELLGEDMQSNSSNASRNNALVARKLSRKKALVVIDDVDSSEQLKNLVDNTCKFLREGSKVIITSRDKKLLKPYGYEIHEAKGLNYENSVQLFIRKAFRPDHDPEVIYEQLIKGFLDYTQCNPLALEVLGSLVRSEDIKYWDDLLRKLRDGNPNDKIQRALRLSYDGLDPKDKQIFLDIACFLKGESETFVQELLESYEFYPNCGLQNLKDKALVVTTKGKVEMHDLMQEIGHQIVREEKKKPGKRSRLWDSNEIYNVLKNNEGKEMVEGIRFFPYGIGPLELTPQTFNKMTGIRFLKVYSSDNISIPLGIESISNNIRYFYWHGYPGKSLPSNFCAKHLLELDLQSSQVETLWEGMQELANLRRLRLHGCKKLRILPNFSKASRLEIVDLTSCSSLRYVHKSLLGLASLISLDVSFCFNLESLQCGSCLESLKHVNASGCFHLKEFSVSAKELTSLDISATKIEKLEPSMGRCSKLRTLNLPNDIKLNNLPTEVLSCLTSLEKLSIHEFHRSDKEGLHVLLFAHLRSLKSLKLTWNLNELPDNISQLSCLEELYLGICDNLTELPELPSSLRILVANRCKSLQRVSSSTISSTPHNRGKKLFSFINCKKLDVATIEEQAMRLLEKAVHEKEDVAIYYPGNNVPRWFGENQTRHDSNTLRLSLSSHNLVDFVFCVVVPDKFNFLLKLQMEFGAEEDKMVGEEVIPSTLICHTQEIDFTKVFDLSPGNIVLRSSPEVSELILEKIEGNRRDYKATTYNPNLFFRFSFESWSSSLDPVRKTGVYPIYASEFSELNYHSRKRKAI